ncbi:MAG TPA: integrase arm-type DNA-binding domain-containing protein [Rhodocyclaceae bacterium]|nr:integrase arm-type DNA-binding domain-containing protein [Rhodocyclaceae bacterium]
MGKLSDVQIRNWVKTGEPVAKSDGDGLTFTLSAKGTAAWVLRYRAPGAKSQKEMTIGRYPDIGLGDARKLATEARVKVQQGVDVGRDKRQTKQAAARAWTFQRLSDDYLEKTVGRLAEATIKGRRQQLRDYVMPMIGGVPAREVGPADIVEITERASKKSLHVARLVLIALREVFAHGVARHVVEFDPSAHVKANSVIGPRPVNRTRIMLTEGELRYMLPRLPVIGPQNTLMVKILLATATRIGELVFAEWKDVDFEKRLWTIPAANIKGRSVKVARGEDTKDFVIPMTDQVTAWFSELQTLAFGSRFVLPIRSRKKTIGDAPMEPVTLNAAINSLCAKTLGANCRRFTPHDLRSTARSHLGALGVDLLVAERCLNHSLGGLVAVYDQHDYLTERRKALEMWSAFLQASELGTIWNVVPLHQASA